MNLSQVAGIFRIVAPLLVNVAGAYFGADTVTTVGTVLANCTAAGGWSAYSNATTTQVKTVAAQPGVQVAVTSGCSSGTPDDGPRSLRAGRRSDLTPASWPSLKGDVLLVTSLPATPHPNGNHNHALSLDDLNNAVAAAHRQCVGPCRQRRRR